ncbi:1-acyl-sn-glycerol-3-phosphate acyltransferase, partial [Streptococcus agalactiae]
KKLNSFTYIYRLPLGIMAIVLLVLTLIFSYLASFVWDPKKHLK